MRRPRIREHDYVVSLGPTTSFLRMCPHLDISRIDAWSRLAIHVITPVAEPMKGTAGRYQGGTVMIRQLSRLQRCLVVMVFAIALVPFSAGAQGNSGAAHACQGEGYMWLAGTNGETFRNPGQCTSYAARGGAFAEGAIVVPAGFSFTLSGQTLNACNGLSFGYALSNGVSGELGSKSEGCNEVTFLDETIGPLAGSAVLTFYLVDGTCGATYSSDGFHARVGGSTTVHDVDIADSGPGCSIISSPWPHASLGYEGNLSLTVTVNP